MAWEFLGCGTCRGCAVTVDWWLTSNGKRFPADKGEREYKLGEHIEDEASIADIRRRAHWATCSKASEFRGPRGS